MALGDVTLYDEAAFGYPGDVEYKVAASATTIKAGEPVVVSLGTSGTVVAALSSGAPLVGTDYMVGIAATTSTNTASAAGTVKVTKMTSGVSWLCAPQTATSWDTQSEYDALVGSRVLFNVTSSTYSITATDNSSNGLVVMPLDIAKYPAKVRFGIRAAVNYLA